MRITLVSPQSYRPNVALIDRESYSLKPPVGLLYLAASVAGAHQVTIIDGQRRQLTAMGLAEAVLATEPDLVGVSANFTPLIGGAFALAKCLREMRPGLPLVAGGNCATFLARDFCETGGFDAVFLHEADRSFPAYVQALDRRGPVSSIPGLAFFESGWLVTNPFGGYVSPLDDLPLPRYDLLPDLERYLPTVTSSRGCAFDCIYCSTKSMWRRLRTRTAPSVLREVEWLHSLGCRTTLAFGDDEFLAQRQRAVAIARGLVERGYRYQWGISARIELVDAEVLEELASAGCHQIFFGIESGSDRVRRRLRRRSSVAEVERKIDLCVEHGIVPIASFMVGIPFETLEDARETLGLMRRINTYRVQLSVFTPLIGTPVYERAADYGIHLDSAAAEHASVNIDVGTVVHSTDHLSREEIRELWLEGQGVVMARYREVADYEELQKAARRRRGYGEARETVPGGGVCGAPSGREGSPAERVNAAR